MLETQQPVKHSPGFRGVGKFRQICGQLKHKKGSDRIRFEYRGKLSRGFLPVLS